MIKFYVNYSIDILNSLENLYDEFNEMSTKELFEYLKKNNIEIPYEYEETGNEDDNVDLNEEMPFSEYKETDEFYDTYYYDEREIWIDSIIEYIQNNPNEKHIEAIVKSKVDPFIYNDLFKFKISFADNNSDEYDYLNMSCISRVYTSIMDEDQFYQFIKLFETFETHKTSGMITEYGILPAFCIDLESDNIENLYISLLFENSNISNEKMIKIEDAIKKLINTKITYDKFTEICRII